MLLTQLGCHHQRQCRSTVCLLLSLRCRSSTRTSPWSSSNCPAFSSCWRHGPHRFRRSRPCKSLWSTSPRHCLKTPQMTSWEKGRLCRRSPGSSSSSSSSSSSRHSHNCSSPNRSPPHRLLLACTSLAMAWSPAKWGTAASHPGKVQKG